MRILLSHFSTLDELGGVQSFLLRLSRGLAARGHEVTVVETGGHARPLRRLEPGVSVATIAAPSQLSASRPRSWASLARSAWQFDRIVGATGAEIVHVHFPVSQCAAVVTSRRVRPRGRLLVTLHNSDIRAAPQADPALRGWQRALFRQAEVVTAVSRSLLDDAIAAYPSLTGKGRVVYNGIGPEWFVERPRHPTSPPFVLFAGRLNRMKGVDVLLRAWQLVAGRRGGIELRIAGEGEEGPALRQLAAALRLDERVRFVGRQDAATLLGLYRDAELVVLPSRREGLPLNLLEATAQAAVCVATRAPGNTEVVIDGETGFLVPPDAPAELADAMERVLDLPAAQRDMMRNAARARTEALFRDDAMIESYLRLYRGASAEPSQRLPS